MRAGACACEWLCLCFRMAVTQDAGSHAFVVTGIKVGASCEAVWGRWAGRAQGGCGEHAALNKDGMAARRCHSGWVWGGVGQGGPAAPARTPHLRDTTTRPPQHGHGQACARRGGGQAAAPQTAPTHLCVGGVVDREELVHRPVEPARHGMAMAWRGTYAAWRRTQQSYAPPRSHRAHTA